MPIQLSVFESRILGLIAEIQSTSPENYPVTTGYLLEQCKLRPQFVGLEVNDEATIEGILSALADKDLLSEATSSFSLKANQSPLVEQIEQLKEDNAKMREQLESLQSQVNILFAASPNVSNKHVV